MMRLGSLLFSFQFLVFSLLCLSTPAPAEAGSARVLRVCADPNNLPFSNERLEGFENKIAAVFAREMGAAVQYTWWAQRRGFFRHTLNAGICDLVMGVPNNFELVLSTRPYYRSTYVFLTRKDRDLSVRSLDDPVLRQVTIGVHVIGDDYANPPPAHALAKRDIIHNIKGYSIYGDYARANPPARLVEAVATGEVDVAIAWGPLAGYFAQRQAVALAVTPIPAPADLPLLPFVYEISLGVRKGEMERKAELETILLERHNEIQQILQAHGVPMVTENVGP
jgi:mxaJ protein